ncbi:MAG: sigma-70 family RNA polymerase sigma factor [Acidobacteriota bacterium]|nr:MAG: RNA polymerase sigma factor [Acidobacteriota bacterium]
MTSDDTGAEPMRAVEATFEAGRASRAGGVSATRTGDADGRLMARVRAGDREAFAGLVERHKDALVGYLARLTGSVDRAHELAQETFVRLFQAASRYEERGQCQALIYRIATNLVRSEERRRRRWRFRSLDAEHVAELPAPSDSPQRGVTREETRRVVARAVAELPVHYRVPLVLHEIEGWTVPRIAQTLSLREGTVKSRISRARARLRTRLEPFWNGGDA